MIPKGEIRFRLTLQYDGTGYHGWQVQPHHATVQGELERVVERLTGTRRPILGSGRTDRGVHALGQVASVDLPSHWTADRFRRALNALLPDDIWVSDVVHAARDFHPRYDALERAYLYRVGLGDRAHSPFTAPYCWPLDSDVDVDAMRAVTDLLLGEHSFGSFAKSGQPERGDRCMITGADWSVEPGELHFRIRANRFLHHMVRYLVGTLVDIGRRKRPQEDLKSLLEAAANLVTSPPAPASGLYLTRVTYPDDSARTDSPDVVRVPLNLSESSDDTE